jgi:hypothetical protein
MPDPKMQFTRAHLPNCNAICWKYGCPDVVSIAAARIRRALRLAWYAQGGCPDETEDRLYPRDVSQSQKLGTLAILL